MGWSCHKFCTQMILLYVNLFLPNLSGRFFLSTKLPGRLFINFSTDNLWLIEMYNNIPSLVTCTGRLKDRNCLKRNWYRFFPELESAFQNYQLHFFHQDVNWQFFMCRLFDEDILFFEDSPRISGFIGPEQRKMSIAFVFLVTQTKLIPKLPFGFLLSMCH